MDMLTCTLMIWSVFNKSRSIFKLRENRSKRMEISHEDSRNHILKVLNNSLLFNQKILKVDLTKMFHKLGNNFFLRIGSYLFSFTISLFSMKKMPKMS